MTAATVNPPLLRIRGLEVQFQTRRGLVRAVDAIDLDLYRGERFGLVGESGSGKTTLVLALLQMIRPPGSVAGGQALLGDLDLLAARPAQIRAARLQRVAMVPQGAMNSLNPVMRIGQQLTLAMREHGVGADARARRERALELLGTVGLEPDVADLYPHELSGGMKQRACIALAISLEPELILADEPTSALDVVVQRQIMQMLHRLQQQLEATVLLVGHDMGLMAQFAERVGIMYGGRLVEVGRTEDIYRDPRHPYTRLLIASIPSFERKGAFRGIPGEPLSLLKPPSGCLFHPRCPHAEEICTRRVPPLQEIEPGRLVACVRHEELHDGRLA